MMRREFKYLVPVEKLDSLRKNLLPVFDYDSFAESRVNKEYTVRSIYYDTLHFDYYNEKVEGLKVRKKLRIRCYNEYNENNIVFLEIKRKYDNFISKNRSTLILKHLEDLMYSGDIDSYITTKTKDSIENARRFFFHVNKNYLKPVSLITYDREAFFYKFDENIRLTFDKNLRYKTFPTFDDYYNEAVYKTAIPKYFILEIKFYHGFSPTLQSIIQKFNLTRLAVSKYAICLEAEKLVKPLTHKNRCAYNIPIWNEVYKKEAI